ncbi:MAG: cupin domain-containing protein [Gemmatimonadota bacterium]
MDVVNLAEKLTLVPELWSPHIVAELNEMQFKVARVEGDFIWHQHDETDEAFLVVAGELHIDLPERTVTLGPGELFVVERGVRHRPRSPEGASIVLIEPRGVVNTGEEGGDLTAANDRWI